MFLVWPPFASRSATHLLSIELIRLLVVACGMLVHSSSMAVRRCWILARTGTRCCIRRSRPSQTCSMGHVRWVCWPCKNWDVFSFQASRSLQHVAGHYHAATWGDGCGWMAQQWASEPHHGISVHSKCHQKMHLCSLSITYTCPYHNPTVGHSFHNVDMSKPLTHMTPYMLSAICPVQWKPEFIREENTSPKYQMPSNVSICPLKSVTTMNCSQVEIPMRMTSMQMSFPETVSDSFCRNYFVMQTYCCSNCPGSWSQTILEVKMLEVAVYIYTYKYIRHTLFKGPILAFKNNFCLNKLLICCL